MPEDAKLSQIRKILDRPDLRRTRAKAEALAAIKAVVGVAPPASVTEAKPEPKAETAKTRTTQAKTDEG